MPFTIVDVDEARDTLSIIPLRHKGDEITVALSVAQMEGYMKVRKK